MRGPSASHLAHRLLIVLGALLVGVAIPLAFAQPVDINPRDAGGSEGAESLPETGALDSDGLLGDIDLGSPVAIGAITIGLGGLGFLAWNAFRGGTKFVNSENVLENDARRTIFEYIREHPGAHLRATATALDLSTTNVLWHLRKLEGANLVASRKFEGYKVFYPVEGGVESRRRAIAHAVVRNENAQQILEYILGRPSAHQREIARALGVNHGTIRWHLRKLTEASLLIQIKKDAQTNYYVSELGVQVLGELGNVAARAHAAGGQIAPGAVVPASIALPVQTAQPVTGVQPAATARAAHAAHAAGAPVGSTAPAYGPADDEE